MLTTVLTFLAALGILVLVHEWGHYIVAKLSGVWVEKFSIGFGPKIIGFSRNGTDYRVAPIPLGGFVKLYGQDPLEEAGGDEKKAEEIARDPRSFCSKPMTSKLATVLAGPTMNIVLCLLLMPVVFMVGRLQPRILDEAPTLLGVEKDSPAAVAGLRKGDLVLAFEGEGVKTWAELLPKLALHPDQEVTISYRREGADAEAKVRMTQDKDKSQLSGYAGIEPFAFFANDPVVDTVRPGSPAEKAGFRPGDKIVAIDGAALSYWTDMTGIVQKSAGRELAVTVERNGTALELRATPQAGDDGKGLIGITKRMNPDDFVKKRYGLVEAVGLGMNESLKLFHLTADVLKRLFTGNLSYKSLGGPIQIAKATSSAAESGFGEFIYLLCFLSLQLGMLNLMPIPVLDGGHVAFMVIETVRRKPFSPKVHQVATQLGLVMLLGLMLVVTLNDIDSVWGFSNLFRSIKAIF